MTHSLILLSLAFALVSLMGVILMADNIAKRDYILAVIELLVACFFGVLALMAFMAAMGMR